MAKAIEDYLGVQDPRPTPDMLFDEEVVPQDNTVTSDEFNAGKTQASLELVVYADTDIDLADATTLSVNYLYGDSFGDSQTIYTVTASGATTIDAGELARFVPSTDLPVPGKVEITTDDGAATGTISVWPEYVAR